MKALVMSATVAAGLMLATVAHARYSAVDDGTTLSFSGYCETRNGFGGETVGDQCNETYKLPYFVDFGIGKTDKISLRNDGIIEFVGDLCDSSGMACERPFDETRPFEVLNLCENDSCVIEGAKNNDFQVAEINSYNMGLLHPTIKASWFTCMDPTTCYQNRSTIVLEPVCKSAALINTCSGFLVTYFPANEPKRLRLIGAVFMPIPEPSAWVMLVLGFGGIGATLRSRRRTRLQGA